MPSILFVCTHNARRSQMAEAICRHLAPAGWTVSSAGSKPAARVDPKALAVLRQRGIRVSSPKPKNIKQAAKKQWDYVVGMGCADACPVASARQYVEWDIPDPKGGPLSRYKEVCQEIEKRVSSLMAPDHPIPGATRPVFQTLSGLPVEEVYQSRKEPEAVGQAGHFPFTRGISPSGYRVRPWTFRQFSGHGSAHETNERLKYLLEHGETGLSVAFDLPTLMGIDADDPRAEGEVGKEGVAISSLKDFEELFKGIDLGRVSTSMTINLPAITLYSMYLKLAGKQGVPLARIRGTCQTDILKEFIAQNEFLFPPESSLRLVTDLIAFSMENTPRYFPISVSGYHIREAGATAVEELAFTLGNGMEYARRMAARGYDPDRFARCFSFFFDIHNYFFEEIAKLRAARRIWAKFMKETLGAKKETSWVLATHCQTAGVSLTAQQPLNNVVRTAYQALAAVLGGTQSLHTNSYDEALCLPTEEAVRVALRTQQILAHESGLTATVDPLGGSHYLEDLTDRMENEADAILKEINDLGGVVPALERGYYHRRIAESAYRYENEMNDGRRRVVGINIFEGEAKRPEILKIPGAMEKKQIQAVLRLRRERSAARVSEALKRLEETAQSDSNVVPAVMEAVEAYATVGEITQALSKVLGTYQPIA